MEGRNSDIISQIINKCLSGDSKAQFLLYRQYSKAMYNIAIRFLGNKMDAEDILQESFITVFERLGDLESYNAFGSWLKRIVINNCISQLRKTRVAFEDIADYPDDNNNYHETLEYDPDPVLIHNSIKELPSGARTIFILYALEGYKHREISEMLQISESTSKNQYRRAIEILREKIKPKLYVN
jgi:RNA polymerase sigma factor (sigma-70 family)